MAAAPSPSVLKLLKLPDAKEEPASQSPRGFTSLVAPIRHQRAAAEAEEEVPEAKIPTTEAQVVATPTTPTYPSSAPGPGLRRSISID
jgi:hypothetical protein